MACAYIGRCGAQLLGDGVPSEEIDHFIAISRTYLAGAYVKIALEPLTPSELAAMWSLIHGVEAAMKLRGISLEDELEQLDRDLEEPFAALRALAAGGKRLRPAFCHWAFIGRGGDPADRHRRPSAPCCRSTSSMTMVVRSSISLPRSWLPSLRITVGLE